VDDEFQELTNTGFDSQSSCTLNRYGDLIARVALEIKLPPLAAPEITIGQTVIPASDRGAYYVNCIGFAVFDNVSLLIGGSVIDALYSDFGKYTAACLSVIDSMIRHLTYITVSLVHSQHSSTRSWQVAQVFA